MLLRRLKSCQGISLLETIIGLAVFSVVGALFLGGLYISARSETIHRQEATSHAIASSSIEYVKNQSFSANPWSYTVSTSNRSASQSPSWWDVDNPPLLDSHYFPYSVVVSAEEFDSDGDSILEVPGDDDGIYKVTARVYYNSDKLVFSLEDFGASR